MSQSYLDAVDVSNRSRMPCFMRSFDRSLFFKKCNFLKGVCRGRFVEVIAAHFGAHVDVRNTRITKRVVTCDHPEVPLIVLSDTCLCPLLTAKRNVIRHRSFR